MSAPVTIPDSTFVHPLQIATAPSSAEQMAEIQIDGDGYYEIRRLLGQDDARGANTHLNSCSSGVNLKLALRPSAASVT